MSVPAFNDILEATERLSIDDQEVLVDIMHRRLIEQRREEILRDAEEAEREFQQGKGRLFTPGMLKQALDQ